MRKQNPPKKLKTPEIIGEVTSVVPLDGGDMSEAGSAKKIADAVFDNAIEEAAKPIPDNVIPLFRPQK